jgi:DNA polymerase
MLAAIELPREEVFIANVVKCRPPQNRKPLPDEMESCLPYLRRQIQLIKPTVLLALGSTAAEGLLGVKRSLGELRFEGASLGRHPPDCHVPSRCTAA